MLVGKSEGKVLVGDLRIDGRIILKWTLKNNVRTVPICLRIVAGEGLLDKLNHYQRLKKDSDPWSQDPSVVKHYSPN
jgi:hypothetical protein